MAERTPIGNPLDLAAHSTSGWPPRTRADRFEPTEPQPTSAQHLVRTMLGTGLVLAGLGHLTWARSEFQAQVPDWVPLDADLVVVLSGVVELALGGALALLPRYRVVLGWTAAAFFVAIFPGNISQFVDGDAAFGLDSDAARGVRLIFQPLLVALALWSTGAWAAWRRSGSSRTVHSCEDRPLRGETTGER